MEYRIGWNAGSNASFHGFTDWEEASDYGTTLDEVEAYHLRSFDGNEHPVIPAGLEIALEASGFDWWVETR